MKEGEGWGDGKDSRMEIPFGILCWMSDQSYVICYMVEKLTWFLGSYDQGFSFQLCKSQYSWKILKKIIFWVICKQYILAVRKTINISCKILNHICIYISCKIPNHIHIFFSNENNDFFFKWKSRFYFSYLLYSHQATPLLIKHPHLLLPFHSTPQLSNH